MPDVTLRWGGAADADVDTDYLIEINSEAAGIGDAAWAEVITQGATAPYAPVTTTLNGGVAADATTIILTDGASFAEGDHVEIGGEIVILGTKATHTFAGCTRGAGESLPIPHLTGAGVTKLHESYADTGRIWPAGRYALRYRIRRVQGVEVSLAGEMLAVFPPEQPFSNLVTVWGVQEALDGTPVVGMTVRVTFSDTGAYGQDTGEAIHKDAVTVESDADGFWSVALRRDALRQGDGVYTLTLAPGEQGEVSWTVTSLPPDVAAVNFLET